MVKSGARPRPERTRWWSCRILRIIDFGLSAPEIGGAEYRGRLEAAVRSAIAAGAVDLGTGDMFDAMIEADRRVDQCRITEEASRWHTHALRVVLRHRRKRDRAERRRGDLASALAGESIKLDELDRMLAARRGVCESRSNGTTRSMQAPALGGAPRDQRVDRGLQDTR
ncbi:hypothetical protein N8J89_31210 [Crossiella sp. CA-258035]|uniref:hypothetical protein n=1 Tax=Crossiella sp. CA-258035 TaxID=2981138 RepID=UPI0024BC70C7|nr:hypothetical protein [Crossiella sp. CA-258035]WHT17565.1 hypothetical protein N8J89_31210 [Crossiella sp. CA-258035]